MLFYRAALPLSSRTLSFVAGVIRRHRKSIGSCWRKLEPGQQALLMLPYLKNGEPFAQVAAGFGVGAATAWRCVNETVDLLATRAEAAEGGPGREEGRARVRDRRRDPDPHRPGRRRPPFYSGKHKKHGMNLQVIASPHGDLLWVSGALPGCVHEKKAE